MGALPVDSLLRRQYVTCDQFGNNCTSSGWYNWGRWVLFGAVIVFFFLLFFLLSCISARRRRAQGIRPYYGTNWMPYTNKGPQQTYYNQNPQAAPPYYPPNNYGGDNNYFGGQQTGTYEMQSPPQTYQPTGGRGGENVYGDSGVYEPPAGPPPGKKGSPEIVR